MSRVLGSLNMSVGTSLAFENISTSIMTVDAILVNIRTLIRNAREAYQKEDSEGKNVTIIFNDVVNDIKLLLDFIIKYQGGKAVNVIFYYPTYKTLPFIFKYADLWTPTTTLQKEKASIDNQVYNKIKEKYKSQIVINDTYPVDFAGKGFVLTHYPVDLALTKAFKRTFLLESYTGNIKPFTYWYTKLSGKTDDLFNMPLNKLTIQVFGDRSIQFRSSNEAIKKLIKEIALKSNWTSATVYSDVRFHISNYGDKVTANLLKKLL